MCKHYFLLLVFSICYRGVVAQPATIATQKIPEYILSNQQTKTQTVTMPFAKASFVDTIGMHNLANKTIVSIHYVFTDYPANQLLLQLQKNRINLLTTTFSFLQNPSIEWKVYRQTNGYNKQTAENMLHGFVITYREPQGNIENRTKEIELIKNALPPAKTIAIKDGKRRWQQYVIKGIYPNPREFVQYLEYGDSVTKISTKDLQQQQLLSPRELQLFGKKDSLWTVLLVPKKLEKNTVPIVVKDSTVTHYFTQNPPQQPYSIVADVTASMSPYNFQLLHYLNTALQTKWLQGVCFFNDGDNMPNKLKEIGKTGGIYTVGSNNALQIQQTMLTAMKNGSGSDLPENDCEAIITAQETFTDAAYTILIADNISPVRDIELLPKITKPVHIIISGKGLGIHLHYLNMAYKTKGSIFFSNSLFNNFDLFNNNKAVFINGVWYIKKGNAIEHFL